MRSITGKSPGQSSVSPGELCKDALDLLTFYIKNVVFVKKNTWIECQIMYHAHRQKPPSLEPAGLNIFSRINAAMDVVDLALQQAQKPIITTKFGSQSAVLLHLAKQVCPGVPVVWIDSGYNTKATRDFAAALTKELELNLHIYRPLSPWNKEPPESGDPTFGEFVERVKMEPFKRALGELNPDVWFTALRREQTDHRDHMSLFQTSDSGTLKVCPLIDWRALDMSAYLGIHQLGSGHEYHDPTKPESHLECGLHKRF